jgi:hypothetical protein
MKENYNYLSGGVGNYLPPPGSSRKVFANWLPSLTRRGLTLATAILFMFTTAATFAQDGETCATAIDLGALTSPFEGTTVGATDDFTPTCGSSTANPDLVFSISVPSGYTLNIGQTSNIGVDANGNPINYDSIHSLYFGTCGSQTLIECNDDYDTPLEVFPGDVDDSQIEWENTTGSTQTVYWYQDGYNAATGVRVSAGEFVLAWTLTPPPTCNIPTNVTATVTSATLANLSWGAPVTGTVTGYQYAVTTSDVAPTTGFTATTATSITGAPITVNQTNYLYVRANCGTSGGFSEWVRYSFYSGICVPSSTYINGTGITNVALGSINNSTGQEATNYGNYSAQVVNIGQGVTQSFSVTLNGTDVYNVKVWVDWNDNLTFDENEEVFTGTTAGSSATPLNGTFTVPATATLGNHRLRIGATVSWNAPVTPCSTSYYSTFEDYTVNVTVPPTCYTPSATAAVNAGPGLINISWAAPSSGAATSGYQYVIDTNVAAPTTGFIATTATSVTNITVPVNVRGYLHVRSFCGGTDYSEWVTVPYYNGFCIPTPSNADGDGITNVTIGSINNTTPEEPGNYGDYSAQVVNIGQGVTQPFSITFSTGGTDYITRIWVDWNNDLDFDDEGEEVFAVTSASTNPAIVTGTFTVPATASLGNHRIRIGGVDYEQISPCFSGSWGSFEDYTINVTNPPSCFTPSNAAGVTTASGIANLSWTAPTLGGPATGYEYVVDTNVSAPTVAGTATTATSVTGYTGLVDNTYYYLHVRTNCGSGGFSEWVTSAQFRFLQGDTCATAISLDALTSPVSSTTVGATNDFTPSCGFSNAPDMFYSITVPNGYVLVAGLTASSYDSEHVLYYGGCDTQTQIVCTDSETDFNTTWENTTGSTQTVYWVQDGWSGNTGTFTLAWTLTPPPACNIPRNVTGTMVTLTTANISWTVPVTGTPVTYEYAVTQSDVAPSSGTITTSLSFTNVPTVANEYNYVWVRTNCAEGNSEWVKYSFYSGHCIPTSNYFEYYNLVSFVTTNGFSNISSTDEQTEPYVNSFNNMIVGQEPGGSFSYTLTTDTYTNADIWVDWNNDLDFDDEGELVATHTNQDFDDTEFTGTITIPGTTVQGNYRMRIRTRATWLTADPCDNYDNGAAQDFAISIGDPPTCYTPINATGVAVAQNTADLSWAPQNLGDAPVGYEYVVNTSTANPTAAGTAVTGTTVTGYTGLADNTWYYLHVRTNCGDGDYSQWATSRKFRYLAGDTCASAINLANQTSPYSFSTVGAADEYTASCSSGTAPDLYYYINVPNGAILTMDLTASNYSTVTSVFYGSCDDEHFIECTAYEPTSLVWENTYGEDKTVYWVQDGMWGGAGTFTLTWGITPPPSCDKPRFPEAEITSLTTANVSWTVPNTGTAVGYEYAVTQSATQPVDGDGTYTYTTALSVTGVAISPNVDSYLWVRTVCSTEDGRSVWVSKPFFSGYCVPRNTNTAYNIYYITGVTTTGGETNINSTSEGFSAFTDYTATQSVSTYAGGSIDIQVTTPVAATTYRYSVWIDWNNNFDFSDAGERVLNSDLLTSPASLPELTIPEDAPLGTYRMRIRNAHFGSPVPVCGEGSGEAEDYTLNIVEAPTCFPPYQPMINPTDSGFANLSWAPPILGNPAAGYEYILAYSSTPPAESVSGTPSASFFVENVEYDSTRSAYLFVRSVCGGNDFSAWTSYALLGIESAQLAANKVIVYKDGGAINITSGNALMKGVSIYDIRGRKLYDQADINNSETAITGLQIQQQVIIVEVRTEKGIVRKKIVF